MMTKWKAPDLSDPRLAKADTFAMAAHAAVGQFRKYSTDEHGQPLPYIVHPRECVAILQSLPEASGITMAQLIAMMLHDTVEDTRTFVDANGNVVKQSQVGKLVAAGHKITLVEGITFGLVKAEFSFGDPTFGDEVVRVLSGLTDVSMPWDGKREVRKAMDLAHTAEQAGDVKTDKLADLISNAPSIIEHDPGFARKWMNEKQGLLGVLKDGGDPILFNIAHGIMDDYLNRRHNQI